jgi:uncharacterized membrane protein SpoIIM required for sporulation
MEQGFSFKSIRFRKEREATWQQLEALIAKIDRHGRASLTAEECLALPRLYRATLSGLSVARAISLDVNVVRYLEGLVLKSYMHVYGSRTRIVDAVRQFFLVLWPQAVRSMWIAAFLAIFVLTGSWIGAHHLVSRNPEWYYTLVGSDPRSPTASAELLCSTVYEKIPPKGVCAKEMKKTGLTDSNENEALSVFAAFLFTHNASISLLAFALGFAFGIPTILLLFFNGAMGGGMTAVFAAKGIGYDFYAWLAIHGTTELLAIALCGAAGLHMGSAAAFPGDRSRLDALAFAGRKAAIVAMGGVVMLAIAGLLEGFGRQLIQSAEIRYAVGGVMLLFWIVYFTFGGRRIEDGRAG